MPKPKKSLAQMLADISNPAPDNDWDPESMETRQSRQDSSDEDSNDDDLRMDHYEDVGELRKQLDMDAMDPKYVGKKTSRSKIYESESESGQEDAEDSTQESEQPGESMEESVDSDMESMDSERDSGEDSEGDSEGDSDDANDSDEDSTDDSLPKSRKEENIKRELEKLKEAEADLVKNLSKSADAEVEKGRHIREQISTFEALLDLRIRLQKVLALANRLPSNVDSSNDTLRKSARKELVSTLDDLSEFRALLLQHSPAFPKEKIVLPHHEDQGKKRKQPHLPHVHDLDSAWHAVNQLDRAFSEYQDATLDKWWSKVQGVQAVQANKFKALNQTMTSQIASFMKDKPRLRKRTKLVRNDDVPLGTTLDSTQESQYLNHIFDDNDFYSQLLRELINSKAANIDTTKPDVVDVDGVGVMDHVALALTSQQLMLRALQKKNKKQVDTRASKGRKIRYHVMDKLRNFMAPNPGPLKIVSHGTAKVLETEASVWHEDSKSELFAGLFGGNFENPTNVAVEDDGLKLFA